MPTLRHSPLICLALCGSFLLLPATGKAEAPAAPPRTFAAVAADGPPRSLAEAEPGEPAAQPAPETAAPGGKRLLMEGLFGTVGSTLAVLLTVYGIYDEQPEIGIPIGLAALPIASSLGVWVGGSYQSGQGGYLSTLGGSAIGGVLGVALLAGAEASDPNGTGFVSRAAFVLAVVLPTVGGIIGYELSHGARSRKATTLRILPAVHADAEHAHPGLILAVDY